MDRGIEGNRGHKADSGQASIQEGAKSPTSHSLIGSLIKTIVHFQVPLQEQVSCLAVGTCQLPGPSFLGFALQKTSLLTVKLVCGSGGDFLFL